MDTLSLVVGVLAGALAGVIAALKLIAPLTKNTVDDKALEYAEKVEALAVSTGVVKLKA